MSDQSNKTAEQLAELSGKFEERSKRIDAIDEKIDRVYSELQNMNVTLARNTEQLAMHIKRTELNERHIVAIEENIQNEIKPIKEHVSSVNAYGKAVLMLGGILAGIYYVIRFIKEFLV